MTSKTVRQKFLYNVPHFDSGLPMVKLFNASDFIGLIKIIKFSNLCKMDLREFKALLTELNNTNVTNVIIKNDLILHSNSDIIINAINHDMLAFAYWFKKTNINVALQ